MSASADHATLRFAPQHARGIEAFAKFLRLRPQLAVPVAQASIELMLLQPLGQSGQLPPPPVVDAKWKERATGRISMAKVGGRGAARCEYVCSAAGTASACADHGVCRPPVCQGASFRPGWSSLYIC
jgi:hypothetical protein